MSILAIDHGTKRMGLAASDDLGMLAHPLEFVPAEPFDGFLQRLREVMRDRQVTLLLIGMPRNMDGSYGPAAEKVREFVARLTPLVEVPIRLWDERLTSAQANRYLIETDVRRAKRRLKADQSAAAVLLQGFLDSQASLQPPA